MSDPQREVRFCASAPVELRAAEGDLINVTGYAAVFGAQTEIGPLDSWGWVELIERGAFAEALTRGDDVTFLINHGGLPLARTSSGTLTLTEDQHGLRVDTALDAADPDVQRILPKMKRGDLSKMSFAFVADKETWDETGARAVRTIQSVRLYDVSIVTDPAYEGTEIGLRSKTAALGLDAEFFRRAMQMRMRLSGLS
ncbi:HK97 family phage prohead protease [Pseudodonghicola flavimaris]|uniref:HK97 family phage prohead protease n=1 Tax=Pseudodonghicola flavimaris TaxID=3050036 RepID=A0ABT7EZ39_9RHOB|nr:HK97 family phage prohead protease [Pseudodonghicola flavimaris]MDK3017618.1 HK97 family phage prohead protease [Pseudodonghicola flavimaris]